MATTTAKHERQDADGFAGIGESRYAEKQAFKADESVKSIQHAEDVPAMMERLRATFGKEKTFSREWRVGQINALLRLCEEGGDLLREALYKDLHKSPFESDIYEFDLVLQEARHALDHLDEWMGLHEENISPLNKPGKGYLQYDPLGVVLIMGAWNYPLMLALAPMVGAIAAGNCVVLKPGSYAPSVSHALGKLVSKYMDPECIVVCEGDRSMTDALLKVRFDKILFTGSGFVGKIVAKAAAEHLCPVVLELGGKSPCIVDKDANLELAASRLVWGAFANCGQTCIRPDHCLVHEDVGKKFVELCKKYAEEFYTKDNVQKTEWFGRIINDGAAKRLGKLIDESRDNIVYGGKYEVADKFVTPTIIDYGTDLKKFDSAPAMQDEIFGPLLPIAYWKDFEKDVIQRVRALPTGKPLALYVFSGNQKCIDAIITRTTSGGLSVNDVMMHIANHDLPFGGVGQSGMGSYHGFRSFKTFSHEKGVLVKFSGFDGISFVQKLLAVRFPPYTNDKQLLFRTLARPTTFKVAEFFDKPQVLSTIRALVFIALLRMVTTMVPAARDIVQAIVLRVLFGSE